MIEQRKYFCPRSLLCKRIEHYRDIDRDIDIDQLVKKTKTFPTFYTKIKPLYDHHVKYI